MKEVSVRRKALVVNSIGMRMPVARKTDMRMRRILRKVRSTARWIKRPLADHPNLWVFTPISIPMFRHEKLRRMNARLVAFQVGLVARILRLHRPAFLIVVPTAIDVLERLKPGPCIYYRADDHAAASDVDRGLIESMENRLIRHCSFVLYSSSSLMELERDRTNGTAVFFDHGVEIDHFARVADRPEPADIAAIPHPRVGFFGQIEAENVDFELVERLAQQIPEAHFVMIGRVAADVSHLSRYPNVHFLGWRDYELVPSYGQFFDVAICPKPASRWVASVNPIKLKEYLALGLPVVSTHFGGADRFAEVVAFADSKEDFVAAVAAAIAGRGPSDARRRREFVADASWTARAEQLIELLASARATGPTGRSTTARITQRRTAPTN
jgi:glycosyltransferase involved in cell wall biosynthesis